MMANPHFRAFSVDDLSEIEVMTLALYREDPGGEEMSSNKIQRTVQELTLNPDKGSITVFCVEDAVVG